MWMRWRARALAGAVFVLVVVTGCEVPNPRPSQVVPASWGEELVPNYSDVPYVAGGYLGCGPGRRHESCHGSQTLDIYGRVFGEDKGTLVFVHGGGFTGGDKYPMFGMGVVRRLTHTGWSVVSVNYRLASNPEFRYPVALQDVAAALRWVRANGGSYGLNTSRLVVGGESAGGTLAMFAGVAGNSGNPKFGQLPPLSGWVSFAGVIDLQAGTLSRFWGGLWTGRDRFDLLWWEASPVTWWDPADPHGYLVHGDLDNFVEYSGARAFHLRALDSQRVRFDSVDYWEDGSPMPVELRGHVASDGVNSVEFQLWLDALPTVHQFADPFGNVDAVVFTEGAVTVSGWAIDPDTVEPVTVRLFVGGEGVASVVAKKSRPDVGRAYPLYGAVHGFSVTVPNVAPGSRVCAVAMNVGPGNANTSLGCSR